MMNEDEFDIVKVLEHKDPHALSQLQDGAVAVIEGDRYTVEEHGLTEDGDWYVAGNETEYHP